MLNSLKWEKWIRKLYILYYLNKFMFIFKIMLMKKDIDWFYGNNNKLRLWVLKICDIVFWIN